MKQGHFPPGPADISANTAKQYMYYRDFLADPLGKVMGLMAEYGDVWHRMSGETHQYSIANPEMIREILVRQANIFIKGPEYTSESGGLARFMGQGLVTSNGEFWKRQTPPGCARFPHAAHHGVRRYDGPICAGANGELARW